MTTATCKTCPFWTRPDGEDVTRIGERVLGTCHHAAWAASGNESVWCDWWCSEHPQRQRDRLAAMAMQGWLSSWPRNTWLVGKPMQLAEHAYACADAMLALAAKERP